MKWIKCTERMPPIREEVLAYAKESWIDNFKIIKAIYYDRFEMKGRKPVYEFYESCSCSGPEYDEMRVEKVTHWMPLPKRPDRN